MEFTGPDHCDLNDVRAINRAFLVLLGSSEGERLRASLPTGLQPAVQALSALQVQRLGGVPFLLLSLNESDEGYWSRGSRTGPIRDLFAPTVDSADPLSRIATAAAGFLWQLARRNPYAARVISGGTPGWCEQLAAQPLLHVLERVVEDHRDVRPRLAEDSVFWHRLLGAGVTGVAEIRRAAHLCALQTVLGAAKLAPGQQFRTAACYTSVPSKVLRQPGKDCE